MEKNSALLKKIIIFYGAAKWCFCCTTSLGSEMIWLTFKSIVYNQKLTLTQHYIASQSVCSYYE